MDSNNYSGGKIVLNMTTRMLTIRETADLLSVSDRHVRRLLDAGLLQGTRLISPGSGKLTAKSRWRVFADSVSSYLGIVDVKPTKQRTSAAYRQEVLALD